MLTDKLFTGQREMAGLGIYHYQSRFYSPKIGRFLSADTIVPGYANPQNLNRYSYVLNNPLRYIDPTGHVCSDPDDPTPSCENGDPYPNNTHPLPEGPIVINNPGPLDPGLPTSPEVTLPNPTGTQPSFWQGAAVFVTGAALTLVGGFLMGFAIAEVFGGVATGPFEALVALHALAVGAYGLGFALMGVATMRRGFEIMESSPTL